MNVISKLKLVVVLATFLSMPLVSLAPVAAHDGEHHGSDDHAVQTAQAPAAIAAPAEANTTYSYVAQKDDNYSLLARKAVQTYGKKFNVQLSHADIIFIETHLTQAAGSPHLEIGQKVAIAESAIKQRVEESQKLTNAQEAAWQRYAAGANFNTDHVGQAH